MATAREQHQHPKIGDKETSELQRKPEWKK